MTSEERLAAIERRLERVEGLLEKATETFSRISKSPMLKQLAGSLGIKLDLTSIDPDRRL